MSKELRICPGVGARKCGAFLARLDRDPHPTCTRCRGKVCTKDMTCDFCAVWSAEQWELFANKRSYKERKHRPSGSAPSAQQTSPAAETSSGVSRPGTSSSSSSRPLGGQGKQGGVSGGTWCCVWWGFLSSRSVSVEREGWKCLWAFVWRGRARFLLSFAFGWWRWGSCPLSTDFPFPVSPSLWTLPHSHRTFHDVRMRGSLQALAPALYPPAIHALRCVNRGRIRGLGLEKVALVGVAVSLALAPLPVRGHEVESGTGGLRPRHARLVVAHGESGRGLLTAIALDVEALGRGVPGPGPRTGTGHAVTALDVSGLGLLPVTAPAVKRARSPTRRRGRRDRSRSHASSSRSFDRSRSRERLSASSSRSREAGAAATGQTWNPGGCGGGCLSACCGSWRVG